MRPVHNFSQKVHGGIQAVPILDEALVLSPGHPTVVFNLALAHDRLLHPADASHHYRRFLKLAPLDDPGRDQVLQRIEILAPRGSNTPPVAAPGSRLKEIRKEMK